MESDGRTSLACLSAPRRRAFEARLRPMTEAIRSTIFELRALATVRDALFPTLLSGKIRVKDAETTVEGRV